MLNLRSDKSCDDRVNVVHYSAVQYVTFNTLLHCMSKIQCYLNLLSCGHPIGYPREIHKNGVGLPSVVLGYGNRLTFSF